LVNAGEFFISLDFASYFDQFVYNAEVGELFCFRQGNAFFRLNTLAMGQRQSVEVAHTATRLLLDFPKKCRTESVIDNVIFVGSREDVLHDVAVFLERVKSVHGQLNEDTDDLEKLLQTQGDWCGVHLNLDKKTVQVTQKVLDKLDFSWDRRQLWSWRNFAAHIGLLFWSWGIVDAPMAEFFPLLRFLSNAGNFLTAHDDQWDEPANIWPSVWPALTRWTEIVKTNFPKFVPPSSTPTWLMCTDASIWGWGYVALDDTTGEIRFHGAPWSSFMRQKHGNKLGKSTFAEPHAIYFSLCHLLSKDNPKHVRIGTDNTVAQASYNRGFNTHSFDINESIRLLHEHFGNNFKFEFVYIPGVVNPADSFSRGKQIAHNAIGSLTEGLRRLLGSDDQKSHL
jgi:hypothetical protein